MAKCDITMTISGEGSEGIAMLASKVCEAFSKAMGECSEEIHYKFLGTCLVLAGMGNQNGLANELRDEVGELIKMKFNI